MGETAGGNMRPSATGYALDLSSTTLGILILTALGVFFLVRAVREAVKSRSWKKGLLTGSIGTTLLIAAIILALISGSRGLPGSSFYMIYLGSCAVLFILWQFLRRIIGSLLVLAIAGMALALILFIRSLVAFTGESKIATITVLDSDKRTITLHIEKNMDTGPDAPTLITLQGARFGTVIYQVVFDNSAVFLSARTRYAWLGVTAFSMGARQTDLHLFHDSFKRMTLFNAMERKEIRLPFIRSVQLSMDSKIAEKGRVYEVLVKNNGGIIISPSKK